MPGWQHEKEREREWPNTAETRILRPVCCYFHKYSTYYRRAAYAYMATAVQVSM